MIIINEENEQKSQQGIFQYSPEFTYELGDFVVEDDCIFICKSKSVKGKMPSTSPADFKMYPGEKIMTAKEYYEYVNDESGTLEDKYISAKVLHEVLQHCYFGYSESGIISESIKFEENSGYVLSDLLSEKIKDITDSFVLDRIMRAPDLNNGVIQVSENLPELNFILLNKLDPPEKSEDESTNIILRQYTYYSSVVDKSWRRVQELVDVKDNQIYVRHFNPGENTISEWKCTVLNTKLLNHINKLYENKQSEKLAEEQDQERSKFYFEKVDITEDNNNSVLVDSGELTITIATKETTPKRIKTITIDSSNLGSEKETYDLADLGTLEVSVNDGKTKLTLQAGVEVKDIYKRIYEQ